MSNEELLKELERLKSKVNQLESANKALVNENEALVNEKDALLKDNYDLNQKLNEALLIISNYQEKYNIERIKPFISKGEKIDNIVINEVEETIKKDKQEKKTKTNKGKKYKTRKVDYEKLVSETRYLEPEEEFCPTCGEKLVIASEKVRYVVEIIPSKMKVIKLVKRSKKCPHCNKTDNKIYYPLSDVLGGSILTPSLGSYVLYYKYELGIPFDHLAKHISSSTGIDLSKQNLAYMAAKLSNIMEPIFEAMKNDLLNNESKVIHSDETTLVVTKRDEDNQNRKKSYMYVYTSSFYDSKQIRIYDFHESRSIEATKKWLDSYQGTIICDNFEGYNKLKKENPNIKLQKCWAHVRRRFADIVKALKSKDKKNSIAYQILQEISKLFELEKNYKKDKLTPNQINQRRNIDVPKIKQSIEDIVTKCNPAPNSALSDAISYMKDCWNDLFTYLDNGCIEITNNSAERAVKPFVCQRKVFQTSGSYAGAKYTGKLFSIIQTCKLNNINVDKYLNYVLTNIDKIEIKDLLPYSKNIKDNI